MASLHFRHASVNTAFEPHLHTQESSTPRARTPSGHDRGRSLGSAEKADEVVRPLLQDAAKDIYITLPSSKRHNGVLLTLLWIMSLLLVSLFTYLASNRPPSVNPNGTFLTGYTTDLREARSAIRVHKQHFYGSLDFRSHRGFVPEGSPSLKYMGEGDEVDAAWDELTKDRYFLLSEAEAREAFGNPPNKYWNVHHGGYVAGLDALHTLHCLNHLRMSLYPDHYPQDPKDGRMHNAHCVDHLRQLVMCNADLTPVPTQWFNGLERNYINSSREHTCRDFGRVREWATERFNGSTAVKARNRDGSLRANFYEPWTP